MTEPPQARSHKVLVPRHSALVRLTHWVNVISLLILLMSGLQIFNAHPALYWGAKSTFAEPWLSMRAVAEGSDLKGVTTLGKAKFDTTGLFGASVYDGGPQARGFPGWATLPGQRILSVGRRWHFFFAWLFAINGIIYLASGVIGGHLKRDLLPTGEQLKPRHILHEIADHARLRFPKGESARRYNVIQKFAYLAVILILLPVIALTGMTMSPGLDTAFPWLLDLFGGRQSARSIHFICANLLVLFVIVHLIMVVLSGFWNNVRSMITGRYAIEEGAP
ncbi:MAG TPA: cytochrome b/b6 domain-containing protein [Caulobacteraceae bacterium]|jgi:thiosulfate reductase cytochrome b subunit|nr:cytochrome b/b6 domain-containing protein [Caulobacteraceae bacterium]